MTSLEEEMTAVLEEGKVTVLEGMAIVKPGVEASTVLEGTVAEMFDDAEADVL